MRTHDDVWAVVLGLLMLLVCSLNCGSVSQEQDARVGISTGEGASAGGEAAAGNGGAPGDGGAQAGGSDGGGALPDGSGGVGNLGGSLAPGGAGGGGGSAGLCPAGWHLAPDPNGSVVGVCVRN